MIEFTGDMVAEAMDLDVGETMRINHEGCTAGADVRRRLYLTRPDNSPGVVLAYCHNCQESGYYKTQQVSYRRPTPAHSLKTGQEFSKPCLDSDIDTWPNEAIKWLYEGGVSKQLANWWGIEYAPTHDRLYLPIYQRVPFPHDSDPKKELVGYQLRAIHKGQSPKYLTATKEGQDQSYYTFMGPLDYRQPMWTVVVEDLLSGLRIYNACVLSELDMNLAVIVNYGVKLNLDAINNHRDPYEGFIVWFDNDGTQIEEAVNNLARSIQLVAGKPVLRVKGYSDPKHFDDQEIVRIITDITNG